MKIFVTVGTTAFNSLIQTIDERFDLCDYQIVFQIANGSYKPKNFTSFKFITDIEEYYLDADIIITHAGAGSVYRLLELNKKVIVVPNKDRVDSHQEELAHYIEINNYGLVCWDVDNIRKMVNKVTEFDPILYVKEEFFGGNMLKNIINNL